MDAINRKDIIILHHSLGGKLYISFVQLGARLIALMSQLIDSNDFCVRLETLQMRDDGSTGINIARYEN